MAGGKSLRMTRLGAGAGRGVALLDLETFDIWGWPWFSELLVELSIEGTCLKNLEVKCNILI